MQECSNSSVLAMKLLQSCTKLKKKRIIYKYEIKGLVADCSNSNVWYVLVFHEREIKQDPHSSKLSGIILCKCPANERRHYIVPSSLIDWAHTQNDPWTMNVSNQLTMQEVNCACYIHNLQLFLRNCRTCPSVVAWIHLLANFPQIVIVSP